MSAEFAPRRGRSLRLTIPALVAVCLGSCGKPAAPSDAPAAPKPELTALLQFWDRTLNEHVYTYGDGQPAEYRRNPNFGNEKVIGYVALKPYADTERLVRAYCRDQKHYFSLGSPPAGVNDIERIEAFIVYVWTTPGDGRVPIHTCHLPDNKDVYFDTDLAKVKDYTVRTLRDISQKRREIETHFYVYPTAATASSAAATPAATTPMARPPVVTGRPE